MSRNNVKLISNDATPLSLHYIAGKWVLDVNIVGGGGGGGGGMIALTDGHIYVGDGSNTAVDVAMSGDVSIDDTGKTTLITISGACAFQTVSKSSNYTIDSGAVKDINVLVDTSGGPVSITLPAPTNGRQLVIKDLKGTFLSNNCTIVRHAAEKIDYVAADLVINGSGASLALLSNGVDWFII